MAATLQYCTMYGIMAVAVTPNLMLAAVLSSAFYSMWNLFAGFIIPKPVRAQSGITFLVSCPCRLLLIAQKELAVEQGQSHASAVQARHRLCFAMHAAALFSRTEMLAGERCMQQPEGRGVVVTAAADTGLVGLVLQPEPLCVEQLRPGCLAAGP